MQAEMIRQALLAGALPLIVVGVLLLVAGRLWRAEAKRSVPAFATVAAVLLALLASRLALDGWPDVSWERAVFGIAALGGIAFIWSLLPRNIWIALGMVLAGSAAGTLAAQGVFIESDPLWLRLAPGVATALVVLALAPLMRRSTGPTDPFVLGAWLGPTIGIIILSGNVKISMYIAAAASALLAVFGLAIWRRGVTMARGADLVIIGTVHLALTSAWLNSFSLPNEFIGAFLLAGFAPLGLWLGGIPWCAKRPWVAFAAKLIGLGAPIGIALWLAISASDTSAYY